MLLNTCKKKSSRLKNKNFLTLGGKNLLQRTIDKAVKSRIFNKIYISSDLKKLKKVTKKNIKFIERPAKLSKDPATITDVMLHACEVEDLVKKGYSLMVVLSVTNPFFTENDIKKSIRYFKKTKFDGLLSISKSTSPPFNAWIIKNKRLVPAFNNSKFKFVKSTECPLTYFSNGAIRIINIKNFLKIKSFHKLRLTFFQMENEKSIDIDNKFEYQIAKKLVNEKFN